MRASSTIDYSWPWMENIDDGIERIDHDHGVTFRGRSRWVNSSRDRREKRKVAGGDLHGAVKIYS